MADLVSNLIDQRRAAIGHRALATALGFAAVAHLAAVAAAVWLPHLLRAAPEPPRYVAVQIVPAARLGVERPRPAPPPPAPAKPEPVPEPEPRPEAPVLPDRTAPTRAPRPAAPVEKPAPARQEPPEVEGRPTGAAGGLSLGAAVAAFDNPSFTYGYYVDQMLAKISSNWIRPPVGSGVEALLSFRIHRDGRIADLRIARSSGLSSFDLAALRAVQSSSPLPPLPRAFREPSLGVNLIVR
jgi:protein TonB